MFHEKLALFTYFFLANQCEITNKLSPSPFRLIDFNSAVILLAAVVPVPILVHNLPKPV